MRDNNGTGSPGARCWVLAVPTPLAEAPGTGFTVPFMSTPEEMQ